MDGSERLISFFIDVIFYFLIGGEITDPTWFCLVWGDGS